MLLEGLTVLVVEDEPLIGELINQMLIKLGASAIVHATDETSALAALRDRKPDVVMLDINLNGIPSYSVAAKLAADNTPFVFCTALEKEALLPPWNMRTSLKKPFTEDRLSAAIAEAIDAVLL